MDTLISEGRRCRSEYIKYAVGLEKRDRLVEEAFPLGGGPGIFGDDDDLLRTYSFEAYQYSNPLKSGR